MPSAEGQGRASRERRREEMSGRIVATALRVLGDEGYEAVTIQRLASELGIAVGALYRYFKSKDALLVAVLHRVMDRLGDTLRAADARVLASEGHDDIDRALLRILVAAEVYVQSSRRYPEEFGLVSALIGDPRELLATDDAAPLLPPMMRMMGELTRLFVGAQEIGALSEGPAGARTVTFWSSLQGILQLHKLGRFGVAALHFEELPPNLITGLLVGWGAPEARVAALQSAVVQLGAPDGDPG
jgi:AcrR family transcriptional regulator